MSRSEGDVTAIGPPRRRVHWVGSGSLPEGIEPPAQAVRTAHAGMTDRGDV